MRVSDTMAVLRVEPGDRFRSVPCSAEVSKQNEFRNFLMSEECLELEQLVANMS